MVQYIYDVGALIDVPEEWKEEYLSQLPQSSDPSDKELKYHFICGQARSNAESKALLIAICGRDPLDNTDDEDDEDESEGV